MVGKTELASRLDGGVVRNDCRSDFGGVWSRTAKSETGNNYKMVALSKGKPIKEKSNETKKIFDKCNKYYAGSLFFFFRMHKL